MTTPALQQEARDELQQIDDDVEMDEQSYGFYQEYGYHPDWNVPHELYVPTRDVFQEISEHHP
jgi:hypothetical protein